MIGIIHLIFNVPDYKASPSPAHTDPQPQDSD